MNKKTAILAAGAECSIEFRAEQWNLANKVVHLLQPFEEATREASGDYTSASVIIPIVNSLKRSLSTTSDDRGITAMKQAMLLSLNQRYSNIEDIKVYALATALDPCFKLCVFTSASSKASIRQMLIEGYEEMEEAEASSEPPEKEQDLPIMAKEHPHQPPSPNLCFGLSLMK